MNTLKSESWKSLMHNHVESIVESILDDATANVYLKDLNGAYLDVNSVFEKISGYRSTDIIGLKDLDLWAETEAKSIVQNDQRVITTQKSATLLENVTGLDNHSKLFLSYKSPLKDRKGKIIGLMGLSFQSDEKNSNSTSDVLNLLNLSGNLHNYPIPSDLSPSNLTKRQYDCLYYLARGMSAKQIANKLNISFRTVEDHFERLKMKFNCFTRSELITKVLTIPYLKNRLFLDSDIIKK